MNFLFNTCMRVYLKSNSHFSLVLKANYPNKTSATSATGKSNRAIICTPDSWCALSGHTCFASCVFFNP